MQAINLKTEYLHNPIGLDIIKPRLFWNCDGGIRQTAYRILAERTGEVIWDTGKVVSNRMTHIEYGGMPLTSRDIVCWKVKLWDENETEGEWSAPATFEMGLLKSADWTGKWITGDYVPSQKKRYPVDCFKKGFNVAKNIAKARLYITACGLYEAKLNGEKVGSQCFTPGFTDYRKRLQYQTYDITGQIRNGDNNFEVELADGWYRGCIGAFGVTCFYGNETKLLCQLELTYADGALDRIVSDQSFAWSNDGAIRFADLKDGEIVDGAMIPSYAGKAKLTSFGIIPTASNNVSVEEHEQLKPKLIITPSGKKVLDFGQNIAGYLKFSLNAHSGQNIKLRFGEILDNSREFTQANIQIRKKKLTPLQEVNYYCKEGQNDYQIRFAVFGFQYVLIETDVAFRVEDFIAIAVYSSMEETGLFECSNKLINRFVENTRWSMKGNFLDVPTDCPTRERAGWTGDAQVFFLTSSYLMNTAPFFRKWMNDLCDRQTEDGKVHCIVPSVGNELYISRMDGCVGWADAAVLIPYRYSKIFNDRKILAEFYPAMKRYAKFMMSRTNKTGLFGKPIKGPDKKYIYNVGQGFGEWLEPKDMYEQTIWDLMRPRPEESTAYLVYVMAFMKEIAEELGYSEDAKLYREYHEGAKRAYNHLFITGGTIDTDRQSKLVRPLAFGILDDEAATNVMERLVSSIERRNYHVGAGFLSTPLLLPLLTKIGRLDIAYKILEQEEMPGWLYEPKSGATTVWENWDGEASHNHYSPGSVCEWLFTTVGGINIGEEENTFVIAPKPGGTLTYAQTVYQSVYGKVECNWKKNGNNNGYVFEVSIPSNTTANIVLPDGTIMHLQKGTHAINY